MNERRSDSYAAAAAWCARVSFTAAQMSLGADAGSDAALTDGCGRIAAALNAVQQIGYLRFDGRQHNQPVTHPRRVGKFKRFDIGAIIGQFRFGLDQVCARRFHFSAQPGDGGGFRFQSRVRPF